ERVATQCGTLLPTLLLTCWQILLWRLTGQSLIAIGAEFDGREYEELRSALGAYSRRLPIRAPLDGSESFTHLLRGTEEVTRAAREWQDYFIEVESPASDGVVAALPVSFTFAEGCDCYIGAGVRFSVCEWYACTHRFKINLTCDYRPTAL